MRSVSSLASKDFPEKRANSTFFYLNGKHYLLGGGNRTKEFNDVWTLSLVPDGSSLKMDWNEIKPKGASSFTPRTGQASAVIGDKLYVFGGQNFHEEKMYDDALCYDISTNEWSPLEVVKGAKPSARNSATLVADAEKKRLYLVGGADHNGPLNDLNIYDIERKEWIKIAFKDPNGPERREMHSGFLFNGTLYPMNEKESAQPKAQEKTVELNFSNNILENNEEEKTEESPNKASDTKEEGQKGGVTAKFLVIAGGKILSGVSDEIWALNLNTLQWILIGKMPKAVCAHASVLASDELFIYGGTDGAQFLDTLYIWNLKENKWRIYSSKSKTDSLIMFRIASNLSYDDSTGQVVLFGGCSYEDEISDVHVIDIKDSEFTKVLQVIKTKF